MEGGETRASKAKASLAASSSCGKSVKSGDDSDKDIAAATQKNEDEKRPAKSLTVSVAAISSTLSRIKKQVQVDRIAFVKTRIEANNLNLQAYSSRMAKLSEGRLPFTVDQKNIESRDLLTLRIQKALCRLSGPESLTSEKESVSSQEDASNGFSPIIFGSSSGGKSVIRPLKLPVVQKIPPYTTWIFLDRNQRMTEDQSVLGRRRIYYDQNGGEALICSDSEEELVDEEEDKHEFSNGDDFIIWMTLLEHGLSEASLEALGNCIEAKPSEIEARHEVLLKDNLKKSITGAIEKSTEVDIKDVGEHKLDDKDLDAAMDSFDNLFCRRCLVFDCRLHGCSQTVVVPSEKPPPWTNPKGSFVPCGPTCHLLVKESCETQIAIQRDNSGVKRISSQRVESASSMKNPDPTKVDVKESVDESLTESATEIHKVQPLKKGKKPGRKPGSLKKKRIAEGVLVNIRKRQCRVITSDNTSLAIDGIVSANDLKEKFQTPETSTGMGERLAKCDAAKVVSKKIDKLLLGSNRSSMKQYVRSKLQNGSDQRMVNKGSETEAENVTSKLSKGDFKRTQKGLWKEEENCRNEENITKNANYWSSLENGLYEKGLEIFGRNSCLIARNMLRGLKTCIEVAEHILHNDIALQRRITDENLSLMGVNGKLDCSNGLDVEVRPRTRFWRRRGRVRRLKYTWKSAGHSAIRKQIADGKDQPCKQYSPCGCQFNCGKQCTCLRNGTCCEKYCGCSRSCKNRFRGCHCAKSQCHSRQCPCFAAGRECDPDVCRNCWVGCGDGTLGGPHQRGDSYECRNMKLLLKQQQRVLLGRSDVAGWGAFLKNPVSKHDYLGEYTGELVSHREADKRGKIYDRENSSFLFNLNDQYVLDAYRKGDKLKFANHSPNPNCYAKVIMVAGDHRVGIFAKERISAGEELFYDYRYEPDRAPSWAKRPESSSIKRDETSTTGGRAQKVA